MKTDTYYYTFLAGDITDALIVCNSNANSALVYASLGRDKSKMVKTAKDDFQKLYRTRKPKQQFELIHVEPTDERAEKVATSYSAVLNGESGFHDSKVPIEIIFGTAFQRNVWAELQRLEPGHTSTYGAIARDMRNEKAHRAVARACAANKIALLIPCHCIINSQGGFNGYRWGVDVKQKLLNREKQALAKDK